MADILPPELVTHIDQEAFSLLGKMQRIDKDRTGGESETQERTPASILEADIPVISNIRDFVGRQGNEISHSDADLDTIGLTHTDGIGFYKLVKSIYKARFFNSKVGAKFIDEVLFKWLVASHRAGRAEGNFSDYLTDRVSESIVLHKIYHCMLYLHIDQPFKVGDVEFNFFKKDFFQPYVDMAKEVHPDDKVDDFGKDLIGRVYATLTVKAQRDRAVEISFVECSLAVDVLKICSATLHHPEMPLSFDIDKRLNHNFSNETIIEVLATRKELSTTSEGVGMPFIIDEVELRTFNARGLERFNQFLASIHGTRTELQKVIVLSIQNLSNALSTLDFHRRIAELFTICESLLLLSDTAQISDTVSKYFCRLLYSDRESREKLISLYKKLYVVRSRFVHHAEREDFKFNDLSLFQQMVHHLLIVLIDKSKTYSNMRAILDEIDHAIMSA